MKLKLLCISAGFLCTVVSNAYTETWDMDQYQSQEQIQAKSEKIVKEQEFIQKRIQTQPIEKNKDIAEYYLNNLPFKTRNIMIDKITKNTLKLNKYKRNNF